MKSTETVKKMRDMSDAELQRKVSDMREDLLKLGFQHGIRQVDNTARLRGLRRDIARAMTILQDRQA